MKNTDKRILIISHNPLSRVNNNGKTLVSIFDGVPADNLYQIYLNADTPDYCEGCHYLQLNEIQILKSIASRENLCCREVQPSENRVSSASIHIKSFGIHTKRLLRECVWKIGIWKSKLIEWLNDKQFDVVFFMAGDGMFAYDIFRTIMAHTSAKGCLFFTDDYLIGKNSYSPVALFRQWLLKRKVKEALQVTQEMYVISEEMRAAYQTLFHFDGYVVRNFSVERKERTVDNCGIDSHVGLTMVYAGGLHYNRWKVLSEIAVVLDEINKKSSVKCTLKIYSSQRISERILERIQIDGISEFCGSASASQIAEVYAGADILVHVESFENKAIAATRYSFSTKIPEYLSAGKCVLAVGPSEVASIKYLKNVACVVCDDSELSAAIQNLIKDEAYRNEIMSRCEQYFEKDFSEKIHTECLNRILSRS